MASLVSSQPRHSVQAYWARRNYQRLGSPSRRLRVARLGGDGRKQRAAGSAPWKKLARAALRLRAAVASARLLPRLRDAYVDAMLTLARTRICCGCAPEAGLLARRVPRARTQRGSSDFERRMMAHIYSAVVTPELPCAANKA
ncbi:hypothetical protein QOZ80_5AG0362260 [Eleusine coracana subsp. coracana]|nr:hypothetical protein QOZ80_5AG0362260 [Eleusine coracana subsp. coracana]